MNEQCGIYSESFRLAWVKITWLFCKQPGTGRLCHTSSACVWHLPAPSTSPHAPGRFPLASGRLDAPFCAPRSICVRF